MSIKRLVAAIAFFLLIALATSVVMNLIHSHDSGFAQHVWYWKELYALATFVLYLALGYILTKNLFSEATNITTAHRQQSAWIGTARLLARAIVFIPITLLLWLRSEFLLRAVHMYNQSDWAQVCLSILFGLAVSFYPTSSLRSMAYTAFLAQVRTLYLFVATILAASFLACASTLAAFAIVVPIAAYLAFAYCIFELNDGSFNPKNVVHVAIIVGAIAVFIMTARDAWNYCKLVLTRYAGGIYSYGQRIITSWRNLCQGIYTSILHTALRIGGLLGGDVA